MRISGIIQQISGGALVGHYNVELEVELDDEEMDLLAELLPDRALVQLLKRTDPVPTAEGK